MLPPAIQAAEDLIWAALLHSIWLGLAAASIAGVWSGRGRASHGARHATLVGLLAVVPVGSIALAALQPRLPSWTRVSVEVPAAPPALDSTVRPTPAARRAPRTAPRDVAGPYRVLGVAPARMSTATMRRWTTAAWAIGAHTAIAILFIGGFGARRLRQIATPAAEDVQALVGMLARRLRLRRPPPVGVVPGLTQPCLAGIFRPSILLPGTWLAAVRADELKAVLAHETAHARRFDLPILTGQRVVESLLFFHPGVHWLSRLARRDAEYAADEFAVRITGEPLALARALESAARLRYPSLHHGLAAGGDRSHLLPRIQRILGMESTQPRPKWPLATLIAALIASIVAVSPGAVMDAPPEILPDEVFTPDPSERPVADRGAPVRIELFDAESGLWDRLTQGRLRPPDDAESDLCWIASRSGLDAIRQGLLNDKGSSSAKESNFQMTDFDGQIWNTEFWSPVPDSGVFPTALGPFQISASTKPEKRKLVPELALRRPAAPVSDRPTLTSPERYGGGVRYSIGGVYGGWSNPVDFYLDSVVPNPDGEGVLEVVRRGSVRLAPDSCLIVPTGVVVADDDGTRIRSFVVVTPNLWTGANEESP